jgi:hypothetical protein
MTNENLEKIMQEEAEIVRRLALEDLTKMEKTNLKLFAHPFITRWLNKENTRIEFDNKVYAELDDRVLDTQLKDFLYGHYNESDLYKLAVGERVVIRRDVLLAEIRPVVKTMGASTSLGAMHMPELTRVTKRYYNAIKTGKLDFELYGTPIKINSLNLVSSPNNFQVTISEGSESENYLVKSKFSYGSRK